MSSSGVYVLQIKVYNGIKGGFHAAESLASMRMLDEYHSLL
jgi:hypothetical protein